MPTNVEVVDVDLTSTVEAIMAEGVTTLASSLKEELSSMLATTKLAQDLKARQDTAKEQKTKDIDETMATVYQKLIAAGSNGLTAEQVSKIITPTLNLIGFVPRLKKLLRDPDCMYRLERRTAGGVTNYCLVKHNS